MKIDENNYLQQLQLHNEDALVYVIETYGGLLKSVVHKHLFAMPEKTEDCLNDVFFCIWKDINSFDAGRNTFKNWAAAVARYQAISYLRKYQRELQQTNIDDVVIPQEDIMLERLIEQELSEEMESMLGCLNERDRQLFLKLYAEEQSIEEISRETGMKKSVIYNRISRGRQRIRTQYLKERKA